MRHAFCSLLLGTIILAGQAAAGDVDPRVARLGQGDAAAKQELIEAGAPAIGPLFDALASKDPRLAWEARSALRWIAVRATGDGRKAVVEAVLPHLDAARPLAERRVAVEMLGHAGSAAEVAALAKAFLQEPALAEPVVLALSQMGGDAGKGDLNCIAFHGGSHLASHAPDLGPPRAARPETRALALRLYGAYCGRSAPSEEQRPLNARLFAEAARDPDEGVRVAALQAIGLAGDPAGAAPLAEALRSGSQRAKSAAFEALLALAAARLQAKDPAAARAIYEQALELAATDEQRAAALVGLGRLGSAASLPAIVPRLKADDPGVRQAACAALVRVEGPAGTQAILDALRAAPADTRPLLIEALGARRDPRAAGPLADAAADRDEAVALAAVRALGELGEPAAAPTLLEAAASRRATPAVKAAAARAAIRLGDALADRGQGPAAFDLLAGALKLAAADADRQDAVRALGKAGDPRALPILLPAVEQKDSALRDAGLPALLALGDAAAATGDRESATLAFRKVADLVPGSALAAEAAAKLGALGVQYGPAARDGYVSSWWMIGPFPCNDANAAKRDWFPQHEISLKKSYEAEGRKLRWSLVRTPDPKGRFDLNPVFKPNQKVLVYAYAELASDQARDVALAFGRDDGLTLWLNGQALYDVHDPHGVDQEEFTVKARLEKGLNRFLLKISQDAGGWGFYLRVTDPEGKPLAP